MPVTYFSRRFLRAVSISNGMACLYTVVLGGLLFTVSLVRTYVCPYLYSHVDYLCVIHQYTCASYQRIGMYVFLETVKCKDTV